MRTPRARHRADDSKEATPATIEDLRGSELFDGVDDLALGELARHSSSIRRLDAQERLYPSRGQVEFLHVILRGYVAVWAGSQFSETAETFLAWRGPGQIIGEMRLLGVDVPPAKVITCEPCEFIEIRRDTLTDLAKSSTQIYRNIARLLVKKMGHERCRSEIIRMSPATRQVAQVLLHLSHERRDHARPEELGGGKIPGILHQYEIGGYVGTKRETISRSMGELKKAGVITYDKFMKGSRITILDRDALERVARGEGEGRGSERRRLVKSGRGAQA